MLIAFSIFLGAVVLGLLLSNLYKRPQPKDVYVNGRLVEIAPLSMFSVELTEALDMRKLAATYTTCVLDGLLIRPLAGPLQPVFQSSGRISSVSRKEALWDTEVTEWDEEDEWDEDDEFEGRCGECGALLEVLEPVEAE